MTTDHDEIDRAFSYWAIAKQFALEHPFMATFFAAGVGIFLFCLGRLFLSLIPA